MAIFSERVEMATEATQSSNSGNFLVVAREEKVKVGVIAGGQQAPFVLGSLQDIGARLVESFHLQEGLYISVS